MFINDETKMTKIFLGDTLLWEEKPEAVVRGEPIPVKSHMIFQETLNLLTYNTKSACSVWVLGDMNSANEYRRYVYMPSPRGVDGILLMVVSAPLVIQLNKLSGNYNIQGTSNTYTIGNDTYSDAYRYLTTFMFTPISSGQIGVKVDCTTDRNDVFLGGVFLKGKTANDITFSSFDTVSSENMTVTPPQKEFGNGRIYILSNLYSGNEQEPYNNWSSSLNSLSSYFYNRRIAVYVDDDRDSTDVPTFTLSNSCATDGVHGPDLPSVGGVVTIDYI